MRNPMNKNILDREISFTDILKKISWQHILILLIIIAAILTRFVNLGERVMSHDEVNHVVPSYDLYTGVGYSHDPISHGPLQFHLIALSYFLFGDSDFTSRIPHALASVATIVFVLFAYRKYFGKKGATITGILFLISPLLMFYGRYARNEALVGLFLVIMLYAIMRYFKQRDNFSLFLLTITLSLHFTAKETAYIHTAILMIFLFFKLLADVFHTKVVNIKSFMLNVLLVVVILASVIASILLFRQTDLSSIENAGLILQNAETQTLRMQFYYISQSIQALLPGLIPLIASIVAVLFLRKSLRWDLFSASPAFNLFVVVVTLVLPLLAAFPVRFCGYDPILYTSATSNMLDLVYILYLVIISIVLGLNWKPKFWWKIAVLFYAIFFLFYTTFMTNMTGALTGIVGSLGYWLAQQDVNRGNQPIYYYALLQMPFYEFLAIAGSLLAVILAVFKKRPTSTSCEEDTSVAINDKGKNNIENPVKNNLSITTLLLFWGISSLIAFSIAGEKMPWLTVHIAIPFLLLAGYGLGKFLETIPWKEKSFRENLIGVLLSLLILFLAFSILITLVGNTPPFQGKTQQQLRNTYHFLFQCILLVGLVVVYRTFLKDWAKRVKSKFFILALFIILGAITGQSALRASFENYNYPTEYLVYAHAAPGPKEILEQIEEISLRLTGSLDIRVAYDNHSLYPFWWYFRDYPNRIGYMENPTRSLEDVPIILAGQANYSSVEPIIRNNYYAFDYYRLWWPNQDYFNLTPERITSALLSADMRQAIFNIWFYRDYSLYSEVTNNSYLELSNWSPSEKMRMYIRKDIVDQMWDYINEEKLTQIPTGDALEEITTTIYPEQFIGGDELLNEPRGIDIAPDGSIYVADSKNNQIKHFSTSGILLDSWGSFGSITDDSAPGGTFYEPWDVAVAPDGTVYVADTWNHRIQKFTAEGDFINMWGYFAQSSSNEGYWGPRSITVDDEGYVYFADTGNKRIVVFDKNDSFVAQFGSAGSAYGQFDEPVGLALDEEENLYIADTWNSRVQVLKPELTLKTSTIVSSWEVDGWYGESTDNKPFIAVNSEGNVFVTDPEGSLVLEYSTAGELVHVWDIRGITDDVITMPVDIEFDENGTLWLSDAASNMIYAYTLPEY